MAANDIVARLGGDEFLVLVLGAEAKNIDAVADRLSQRLQQPLKVSSGQILDISAAVGQSHTSGSILRLNDLLRNSDHAMYQAKGEHKQTVVDSRTPSGTSGFKEPARTGFVNSKPLLPSITTQQHPPKTAG